MRRALRKKPDKLVDVGYRVHVYCTGTGSPAVVIVGAGFSLDWGLVQLEVAKFTQVCGYDHSGIGWSDDGPILLAKGQRSTHSIKKAWD